MVRTSVVSNSGNSLSADVLAGIINIEYGVRYGQGKKIQACNKQLSL